MHNFMRLIILACSLYTAYAPAAQESDDDIIMLPERINNIIIYPYVKPSFTRQGCTIPSRVCLGLSALCAKITTLGFAVGGWLASSPPEQFCSTNGSCNSKKMMGMYLIAGSATLGCPLACAMFQAAQHLSKNYYHANRSTITLTPELIDNYGPWLVSSCQSLARHYTRRYEWPTQYMLLSIAKRVSTYLHDRELKREPSPALAKNDLTFSEKYFATALSLLINQTAGDIKTACIRFGTHDIEHVHYKLGNGSFLKGTLALLHFNFNYRTPDGSLYIPPHFNYALIDKTPQELLITRSDDNFP